MKNSLSISIHALREEGDAFAVTVVVSPLTISIHALREEGDQQQKTGRRCWSDFYPRPPRGGRHSHEWYGRIKEAISIHALREEGD